MDLLPDNRLEFAFPEVHPDAVLHIEFQRTLRVPDDGQHHHLPPGLGRFPLRAVDELDPTRVPAAWRRRGGVAMPMWQAEACWLRFSSPSGYPFLLKVAAGRINAVNGAAWRNEPDFADQDYVEVPRQPWLDGFRTDVGTVGQFIAMPLGRGYTVEEQVTGKAEWGGVQLLAHPLKAEVWERQQAERPHAFFLRDQALACAPAADMGLGAGGAIRQVIERARERPQDWHLVDRARCFVHLANSEVWRTLTGEAPPTVPPSAADYTRARLPWFDWYGEHAVVAPIPPRPSLLRRIRSVFELSRARGEAVLPENESFPLPRPVRLRRPNRSGRLEGTWQASLPPPHRLALARCRGVGDRALRAVGRCLGPAIHRGEAAGAERRRGHDLARAAVLAPALEMQRRAVLARDQRIDGVDRAAL